MKPPYLSEMSGMSVSPVITPVSRCAPCAAPELAPDDSKRCAPHDESACNNDPSEGMIGFEN